MQFLLRRVTSGLRPDIEFLSMKAIDQTWWTNDVISIQIVSSVDY